VKTQSNQASSSNRDVVQDKQCGLQGVRNLVFADGSGPDAVQRGVGNQILGGRKLRVAVVTGSRLVRGAVTTLGWFNPEIRAFAPPSWASAFA